ncbi:hypothetical protein JKP88DRAFT_251421 [Tribonema minus]|uniref:Uncharacterized protein n=1 Tax=Tribonema minus TaxID=303371 RepID=A0A835ZHS9_9STRA|nr:hypothetical protein JKP88DRAFT_251421 [Tribonema minus]
MTPVNDATCDMDRIRHLLVLVVTGTNRLSEQHPWLGELHDFDPSAQHQTLPFHVSTELDNADQILGALKATNKSLTSPPDQRRMAERLGLELDAAHAAVVSIKACVRRHESALAERNAKGQHPLQQQHGQPTAETAQDPHDVTRGSAQRQRVAAPAPYATASATLASEPARGVWQMLGHGHWLTVASVSRAVRAAYTRELLSIGGGSGPNCNLKWLTRTAISAALQSDAAFRMALDIRAGAPDSHSGWRKRVPGLREDPRECHLG